MFTWVFFFPPGTLLSLRVINTPGKTPHVITFPLLDDAVFSSPAVENIPLPSRQGGLSPSFSFSRMGTLGPLGTTFFRGHFSIFFSRKGVHALYRGGGFPPPIFGTDLFSPFFLTEGDHLSPFFFARDIFPSLLPGKICWVFSGLLGRALAPPPRALFIPFWGKDLAPPVGGQLPGTFWGGLFSLCGGFFLWGSDLS